MKDDELVVPNFFIVEEKDGSHSAILKFANFTDKKQAEEVVDSILKELSLIRVDYEPITYH
jgi:hypothetical protein